MFKILKNKGTGGFDLIEIKSENLFENFRLYEDAKKIYNDLKKGDKGFEGWTPAFFLIKTNATFAT